MIGGMMNHLIHTFSRIGLVCIGLLLTASMTLAQTDKREVRAGNRKFKKEKWQEAEIDYRRALVKDSLSFAANYNLANALFRQENVEEAGKLLDKIGEQAPMEEMSKASDYYFNKGDVAAKGKQWQQAVDAFKESLLRNPGDLEAKENYIYAKKMLENQQNQQNQQNQNNQNNQNQNNQDQQDQQNKDQQDKNDRNQDQNQQNQNQQGNQDQNKDQQNQNSSGQQPKISPKQAQQMLKAIQAKEKETQDKVKKEKAEALKSKRKEKNW